MQQYHRLALALVMHIRAVARGLNNRSYLWVTHSRLQINALKHRGHRGECLIAQCFGWLICDFAVAQAELNLHFALLQRDQSRVENRHFDGIAQKFRRLVHGGGTENNHVGPMMIYRSARGRLKLCKDHLLFTCQ